jgi:hypothetical protein
VNQRDTAETHLEFSGEMLVPAMNFAAYREI